MARLQTIMTNPIRWMYMIGWIFLFSVMASAQEINRFDESADSGLDHRSFNGKIILFPWVLLGQCTYW